MQNAKSKYEIPKIFACGALVWIELPFYPPLLPKQGKRGGGKMARNSGDLRYPPPPDTFLTAKLL